MTKRKTNLLSNQLRQLIHDSELTRYRIAVDAKIDHSQMTRFMQGKARLTTDSLDRIGVVMNLELKVKE